MRKSILISVWLMAILIAGGPGSTAQSKRPKQALRDLEKRQEIVFKDFQGDIDDRKAQPWDWEDRLAEVRLMASGLASSFKIADWEGEELLALADIFMTAEDFSHAADTYRAFIASDPRKKEFDGVDIRVNLAQALIESEQFDAAAAVIEELKADKSEKPYVMAALVGLYKNLAFSLRDRGYIIRAADAAFGGYQLADINNPGRLRSSGAIENLLRDQFTMAALYIALNEQMSKDKTARDFNEEIRKYDFSDQIYLRDHFEKELAVARLIGSQAPELKPGIINEAVALSGLRGKVVLLDFQAMWCAPCVANLHHWPEIQSKYGERGLEIIAITRLYGRTGDGVVTSTEEELKALRDYRKRYQMKYPLVAAAIDDVTNEERFGVESIPTAILIDRNGRIRHIKRGIGDYRQFERVISRLLGEGKD